MEEREKTLLNDSKNYLTFLEIFNNNTSSLNGHFYKLEDSIFSWNSNLENLFQKFTGKNKNDIENEVNRSYTKLCEEISISVQLKIKSLISDFFTQSQIHSCKNILLFFQEMCKIFYNYQPDLNPNVSIPNYPLVNKIKTHLPKALQTIANKLDTTTEEFASLSEIPPTFPTYKFSFVLLLSELVTIEKNKTLEEAALISLLDQKQLPYYCPSPNIVAENEKFQQYLEFKKVLFNQLNEAIENAHKSLEPAIQEFNLFKESITSLLHILTFEAPQIAESIHNATKKHIKYVSQIYENNFIIQIKDQITDPIFPNTLSEYLEKEKEILNTIQLPEIKVPVLETEEGEEKKDGEDESILAILDFDFTKILNQIEELLPKIEEENKNLDNILTMKTKKLERIKKAAPTPLKRNSKFDDKILELENKKTEYNDMLLQAIDLIDIEMPFDSCFSFAPALTSIEYNDSLYFEDTLDKYWLSVKDYFLRKRGEKIGEFNEIYNEVMSLTKRTVLLDKYAEILSRKKKGEAPICATCEINRSFVIGACGHSFCEGCIREMTAQEPMKCKYCGKEFSQEDIIKIEW